MKAIANTHRRDFLSKSVKGTLVLSLGMSTVVSFLQSYSPIDEEPFSAENTQTAMNEKEFRIKVLGPAELSLVTSQIAVDKATNMNAKEFAGFELTEAIAVTKVLKDLGTKAPQMDSKAKATLDQIKNTAKGLEFDKVYITAQLKNHEFLRDLAESYLKNSSSMKSNMAEMHGRNLATLALATFKEHVAITKRISEELG